ncbi:MAG: hypothetical protein Kow00109_21290 [Acidobacteriota bacterium]
MTDTRLNLPRPRSSGPVSVEEALLRRRSHREYGPRPLRLAEIGQILWAAYGVTSPQGYRTAPSARALFPLGIYTVASEVEDVVPGLYRYDASEHVLELRLPGDWREGMYETTFEQECIRRAPAVLVITADKTKCREAFGDSWERYAAMDVGHVGQNIHLQAEALGLGTVVVCAFRPKPLEELLELPSAEVPLYLMPVGAKKE